MGRLPLGVLASIATTAVLARAPNALGQVPAFGTPQKVKPVKRGKDKPRAASERAGAFFSGEAVAPSWRETCRNTSKQTRPKRVKLPHKKGYKVRAGRCRQFEGVDLTLRLLASPAQAPNAQRLDPPSALDTLRGPTTWRDAETRNLVPCK